MIVLIDQDMDGIEWAGYSVGGLGVSFLIRYGVLDKCSFWEKKAETLIAIEK